ncbi:MAG: CoA transferase, partial [Oxalobacteraceae bacterium]|nr:CoA transferase [Oxalobacteraceae bacterium]
MPHERQPVIVAVGSDSQFVKFAGVISPDLIGDKRFSTNQLRVENREELNHKLSAIFSTQSAEHWIHTLGKVNIPAGEINNVKEAFDLAQSLGLNSIVEIDGVKSVANPI